MSSPFEPDEEMMKTAGLAVKERLCLHCLGRLFAKEGSGFTNVQRGEMILKKLDLGPDATAPVSECILCQGLFDEIGDFVGLVEEAANDYEYDTFLVGTKVDPEVAEAEEALWEKLAVSTQEPIKSELNREVGKKVEEVLGKPVDFEAPDLTFVVDTRYNNIELTIRSLFIYGRYRKLERGIPQTKWFCRKCRGRGCDYCGGTGKMYPTSVEELMGAPVLEEARGEAHSFHGMGREDIDALMLGNGRPFVLEITKPLKRSVNLAELQETINSNNPGKIEVEGLEFSDIATVRRIKSSKSRKTYRAQIEFEVEPDKEKVYKVASDFRKSPIQQRTPKRVSHRRADLNPKTDRPHLRNTRIYGEHGHGGNHRGRRPLHKGADPRGPGTNAAELRRKGGYGLRGEGPGRGPDMGRRRGVAVTRKQRR